MSLWVNSVNFALRIMATTKKTFPVSGMTCASCATTVEKTLKKQKGVVNASVNFANSSALVEYKTDEARLDSIKQAVESTGYGIDIAPDANDPTKVEECNRAAYMALQLRTIF